jgi:hypothetical protein
MFGMAFAFPQHHKKVGFCLDRGSGLPKFPKTRKPTDNTVSVLPSRQGIRNCPDFGPLEKQKRFILCRYILFILFCFLVLLLFLLLFFICFVLQRYVKHGK